MKYVLKTDKNRKNKKNTKKKKWKSQDVIWWVSTSEHVHVNTIHIKSSASPQLSQSGATHSYLPWLQ